MKSFRCNLPHTVVWSRSRARARVWPSRSVGRRRLIRKVQSCLELADLIEAIPKIFFFINFTINYHLVTINNLKSSYNFRFTNALPCIKSKKKERERGAAPLASKVKRTWESADRTIAPIRQTFIFAGRLASQPPYTQQTCLSLRLSL